MPTLQCIRYCSCFEPSTHKPKISPQGAYKCKIRVAILHYYPINFAAFNAIDTAHVLNQAHLPKIFPQTAYKC